MCIRDRTPPGRSPSESTSSEAIGATNPSVENLQAQIDTLAKNYAGLLANVSLLSCQPDLKVMLTKVRAECESSAKQEPQRKPARLAATVPISVQATSRLPAQTGLDLVSCPKETVLSRVSDLEESLGVQLSSLLFSLPHEVIHFDQDNTVRMKTEREQRIQAMVRTPYLPETRLLLITSPERDDRAADLRIEWALHWLVEQGVPASQIDRPWKYPLNVRPGGLRPLDQPAPDERPAHPPRAVFVFRVSC